MTERQGNEYAPWPKEDDAALKEMYQEYLAEQTNGGFSWSQFLQGSANKFDRRSTAISARLKKLYPEIDSLATGSAQSADEPVSTQIEYGTKQKASIGRVTQKKQNKWDEVGRAALDLLENSRDHLFITGQAGTGKTTLLDEFRQSTKRSVVVLAPTGVAAANIGGRTIHSFCGIGPSSSKTKISKLHPNDPHKKVVEHLDMVIIDEVSMMRADLLDFFDKFLRVNRGEPNVAFGGVQIVFVGDLYQLPPVVNREEENMFNRQYPTPYFFSAQIFSEISFRFIELQSVHRQKDGEFLKLLQAIRVNATGKDTLLKLNSRVIDEDRNDLEDFTIYISTTNAIADNVNQFRLQRIESKEKIFRGTSNGITSGFTYPADLELRLKVNAQVMLLNNDKAGRWVNGTVGKFMGVYKSSKTSDEVGSGELLMIETEDGTMLYVPRHKWDVVDYIWDETDSAVETDVIGGYSQFPVKLAWAVTIHKSQGKTFDHVVIDLGRGAFAHGQLYVALSRCRTLEGIELVQHVKLGDVRMDERVVEFLNHCRKYGNKPLMWVPGGLF